MSRFLLPDDMPHNEALFLPFLRRLSFGTIEIETNMAKADFGKIIDEKKLPKNISRQAFHEGFNAYITYRQLWQRIVEHSEPIPITEEAIKTLHADFMRGFFTMRVFILKVSYDGAVRRRAND